MSTLKGKTLFITGASRGIGHAIGMRAARDGANIVIAAKTSEPHPKLPGTIHTAADDMERAGGKALALTVDVRSVENLQAAVAASVERFGGIDILINNASAIQLTGTLETDPKRFDLMFGVNVRGTYMTSQACLPALLKASNPHVLNLSPPLSMSAKWFENHVAYTMAKYGMSMCVLGMAEEFRDRGVAFNALWPRTTIATAAVNMLGGDDMMNASRTPEIMADAAHWILTQPSRTTTGNFFLDEDVLRKAGETDLEKYSVVKGSKLLPDFFID